MQMPLVYVLIANDFGNGSGNLPQFSPFDQASRGILTTSILATLTETETVRISHSGGQLDITTTNATIISRVLSNSTLHGGTADNTINNSWTGTNASYMTVDASCTSSAGTSLHQNIAHICGNTLGMHWIPSSGNQMLRHSSGEIGNTESISLWVRGSITSCTLVDTDTDSDGLFDHLDLDSDGDGCYDKIEAGVTGYTTNGSVTDSLAATTTGEVGANGLDNDIENNDTQLATTSGSYTIIQTNSGTNDFQSSAVQAPDCPCTAQDTDGDGVCDTIDVDDDNDGVLDVVENVCSNPTVPSLIPTVLLEDFGSGASPVSSSALASIGSSYTLSTDYSMSDGQYARTHVGGYIGNYTSNTQFGTAGNAPPNYDDQFTYLLSDHTGNTNGYMLAINGSAVGQEVYRRTFLDLIQNSNIDVSFYLANIVRTPAEQNDGETSFLEPLLRIEIQPSGGGAAISSITIGDDPGEAVPRDATWYNFTLSLNLGVNSNIDVVIYSDQISGQGNDFAIDDVSITYYELLCDKDGDGIADINDLDSDNDGIPDLVEAGGIDTNGDGVIDYPTDHPLSMVDLDGDGLADTYDATDSGGSTPGWTGGIAIANPDSDGDGISDAKDLDSDNDGIPDLVEIGGVDSNGDGLVDTTTDADGDGFADIYDPNDDGVHGIDSGEAGAPLVETDGSGNALNGETGTSLDSDGDGYADHLDLDSDNDGLSDLVEVGGIDTNGDGLVDTTTDVDGDGYADIYDTDDDGTAGVEDANDALLQTGGTDTDGDGKADDMAITFIDGESRSADSDGDGILDHLDLDFR